MNITKTILFFVFALFLSGCDTDDNDPTSTSTPAIPKSISITSDKLEVEVGDVITLTVKDDQDNDVTSLSTILVDGESNTGNTFSPPASGSYEINATYLSLTSNVISVTAIEPVSLTTINVTVSESVVFIERTIAFSAAAVYSDNSIIDKTSESKFYVDDVLISGNEYTRDQEGTIEVKAEFESIISSAAQVEFVYRPSDGFSKKAVVEDYTSVRCHFCPRTKYAASLVKAQTDKAFFVNIYLNSASTELDNEFAEQMHSDNNVRGYPTPFIDRTGIEWSYPQPERLNEVLDAASGTANVGLAVESTLNGSTLQMTISTGFLEDMTDVKLVVFVLEDGVLSLQRNSTEYYAPGWIDDFEHNDVLRYAATDVFGDTTPSTIGIHEQSFTVDLSSYGVLDPSKTAVIAMLVNETGRALNVQYAPANQTQNFD